MHKYLRALPEIRSIQDYLVERAEKAGVPVIENTHMEAAVNEVIHLVLAEVERARDQARV
jgi:2-phosphoglycerate kinase